MSNKRPSKPPQTTPQETTAPTEATSPVPDDAPAIEVATTSADGTVKSEQISEITQTEDISETVSALTAENQSLRGELHQEREASAVARATISEQSEQLFGYRNVHEELKAANDKLTGENASLASQLSAVIKQLEGAREMITSERLWAVHFGNDRIWVLAPTAAEAERKAQTKKPDVKVTMVRDTQCMLVA
jgi:chromosome segregation ATPase